uniref:Uncharacterized protein n=1 Tax=Octopus bimaculoides TaxID=37653 RepID=A0A0L8GQF6_OCTBM
MAEIDHPTLPYETRAKGFVFLLNTRIKSCKEAGIYIYKYKYILFSCLGFFFFTLFFFLFFLNQKIPSGFSPTESYRALLFFHSFNEKKVFTNEIKIIECRQVKMEPNPLCDDHWQTE